MKNSSDRTQTILSKVNEKKRRRRIRWISIATACMSFLVAINLVLFLPLDNAPPSVERYRNSEYYPLIRQINELTYRAPYEKNYRNNFEKWFKNVFKGEHDGNMHPQPDSPSDDQSPSYSEVTNNQVDGVIEGDLFKRSNEYIYYLNPTAKNSYRLHVYSVRGAQSAHVSAYDILPEDDTQKFYSGYGDSAELYLSADCKTITVISPVYFTENSQLYTSIIALDVSDPTNISERERQYVSGDYLTSRKAGNDLLVITQFNVRYNPDFSKEYNFLPQVGTQTEMRSLPVENIIYPENATNARYTVICRFETQTAALTDHYAFLSYSDTAYVSRDNIFLTRPFQTTYNHGDCAYSESFTEISCVSYADETLQFVDSATVPGSVKNQYSMDEYNRILRVATSVQRQQIGRARKEYETIDTIPQPDATGRNAGLYCISLQSFEIVGKLEWFAPSGEEVQSARFDGDTAYVCTALVVEMTDPVFEIDLSDLNNITYRDTGTIDGYSLSLIPFADDTLLGIGFGADRNVLKIELYRAEGDRVISVAKHEQDDTRFSDRFKSYFIDKENRLIGLYVAQEGIGYYLLLYFDGYNLVRPYPEPIELFTHDDNARATYIDGFVYLLGEDDFPVIDLHS